MLAVDTNTVPLLVGSLIFFVLAAALRHALSPPNRAVSASYWAAGVSRRFFVTGCASGIGRRVAAAALVRGHAVLATDIASAAHIRREVREEVQRLLDVARGAARSAYVARSAAAAMRRLNVAQLDVRDATQWHALLKDKKAHFDIFFNIAGFLR